MNLPKRWAFVVIGLLAATWGVICAGANIETDGGAVDWLFSGASFLIVAALAVLVFKSDL